MILVRKKKKKAVISHSMLFEALISSRQKAMTTEMITSFRVSPSSVTNTLKTRCSGVSLVL